MPDKITPFRWRFREGWKDWLVTVIVAAVGVWFIWKGAWSIWKGLR